MAALGIPSSTLTFPLESEPTDRVKAPIKINTRKPYHKKAKQKRPRPSNDLGALGRCSSEGRARESAGPGGGETQRGHGRQLVQRAGAAARQTRLRWNTPRSWAATAGRQAGRQAGGAAECHTHGRARQLERESSRERPWPLSHPESEVNVTASTFPSSYCNTAGAGTSPPPPPPTAFARARTNTGSSRLRRRRRGRHYLLSNKPTLPPLPSPKHFNYALSNCPAMVESERANSSAAGCTTNNDDFLHNDATFSLRTHLKGNTKPPKRQRASERALLLR